MRTRYLIVAAVLSGAAHAAEIGTVPETAVWVADGVTEHTLYVWLDNHGLGGEPAYPFSGTQGAQWVLLNDPGFVYVDGSCGAPGVDDFFEGLPMFWEVFGPPGYPSARLLSGPAGIIDHSANVGEYRFVVQAGTAPGTYSFNLMDTELISDSYDLQPHDIFNDPVIIAPDVPADFNNDGYVNMDDFAIFEQCFAGPDVALDPTCTQADLDLDEDADLGDFARFQRCFSGSEPVSDPGCAD